MKLPPLRPAALCLFSFALALFAGCESGPDRRAMEETRRSVPPMAANETFFDGKIAAHLTLGSSIADFNASGKAGGGGKGAHGGGRGMHGGHHRGGGGAGMGGESQAASAESYDPNSSEELRPRYVDSPMPPAMLHLALENTSTEPITVEIHDLNSELGNFATRPDKFTIEPGGTGEPGAMQSLLGVDSMELPVTLTLRVSGKLETKILTLRPIPPKP